MTPRRPSCASPTCSRCRRVFTGHSITSTALSKTEGDHPRPHCGSMARSAVKNSCVTASLQCLIRTRRSHVCVAWNRTASLVHRNSTDVVSSPFRFRPWFFAHSTYCGKAVKRAPAAFRFLPCPQIYAMQAATRPPWKVEKPPPLVSLLASATCESLHERSLQTCFLSSEHFVFV